MTSRERILAAINHQHADRIPVDLGSTPSSGISAIAYSNLKKYMGLKTGQTRIYDVVQQLAEPEDEILDQFHIDVLDIGRMFNTDKNDWYPVTMANGEQGAYPSWFHPQEAEDDTSIVRSKDGLIIAKMIKGSFFYNQTCFPYLDGYPDNFDRLKEDMDKVHWAAMVHSPWDRAGQPDFWKILREKTIRLRERSDRALMIICGCNLFEWGTFLRRIDNFLMDLLLEPKKVEALLDALMEIHLATLEKVCSSVGDLVDILRFGDDLGIDTGPFMDPRIYRKLFKPRHRLLCDFVKKNSHMHTFLHCCGSIYKLIPDLIDAGFEVLNPVQTNCVDMAPEKLKTEFGMDITFWGGGADTRHILNHATPAEIRLHVLDRLKIFSPGGGFVFNTIHNILPDVPAENIIAMFNAIEEFNKM